MGLCITKREGESFYLRLPARAGEVLTISIRKADSGRATFNVEADDVIPIGRDEPPNEAVRHQRPVLKPGAWPPKTRPGT